MKCVAVMCFLGMGFLLCVNALPIVGNPANLDGVKMYDDDIAKEVEVDVGVGLKADENAYESTEDLAFHPENMENGKIYEISKEEPESKSIKGDDIAFKAAGAADGGSFIIKIDIAEPLTIIDHAAAKAVFDTAFTAALVKVMKEGIVKNPEEKDKEPTAVSSTSIDQERKFIESVNEAKGPMLKPRSSSTFTTTGTSTSTTTGTSTGTTTSTTTGTSTSTTTGTSTSTTTGTSTPTYTGPTKDDTPYVPVDSDLLDDGGR